MIVGRAVFRSEGIIHTMGFTLSHHLLSQYTLPFVSYIAVFIVRTPKLHQHQYHTSKHFFVNAWVAVALLPDGGSAIQFNEG
jgi:hypothetical protein